MLKILYRETKIGPDEPDIDVVIVELRKWIDDNGRKDVILERRAVVDGEQAIHSIEVLDPMPESQAIRLAIVSFDDLLSAHPAKEVMQ